MVPGYRPPDDAALRETLELLRDARLRPHSRRDGFLASRLKLAAGEAGLPLHDLEVLAAVHLFPGKKAGDLANLLRTPEEAVEDCLAWLVKHGKLVRRTDLDGGGQSWVTANGQEVLSEFQNAGEARAFTLWVAQEQRRTTIRQRARPRNRRSDMPARPRFRGSVS